MIEMARIFATAAHTAADNRRRFTNEPYIAHPAAVVEIVRSVPHDEAMIAAAWLHDCVEDTAITLRIIQETFGDDIARLVAWLTDPPGNAATRKARREDTKQRLSRAPARAQTVKVADIIDNTASVMERDPTFGRTYLKEKEAVLDVLTKADSTLHARAVHQIARLGA